MSDITLTLTVDETNAVLQGLGNFPYTQIAPLVEKVRQQAVPQVERIQAEQAAQAPATAPAETPAA